MLPPVSRLRYNVRETILITTNAISKGGKKNFKFHLHFVYRKKMRTVGNRKTRYVTSVGKRVFNILRGQHRRRKSMIRVNRWCARESRPRGTVQDFCTLRNQFLFLLLRSPGSLVTLADGIFPSGRFSSDSTASGVGGNAWESRKASSSSSMKSRLEIRRNLKGVSRDSS